MRHKFRNGGEYIDISCSPDATIKSVIANIAYKTVNASRINKEFKRNAHSLNLKYLGAERIKESTLFDLHNEIHSLLDAVEVLREVAILHSQTPIVVIDEFDRMEASKERNKFADLLKDIGDKNINIKFIFTGVGRSLEELLGAHQSAIRQLETIELPKLGWEGRMDIVVGAMNEFSLEIMRDIQLRIAAVSDGYPYYVHLITEKLLWRLFERPEIVSKVKWKDYNNAVRDSVDSISVELKRPYELAITQRSEDYEEVLWSTADSEFLQVYLKQMYNSYINIMKQCPNKQPLDYSKYSSHIRNLKKPSFGAILIPDIKPGLYTYREKMVRGYVRMQAEAHDIDLIGETGGKREEPSIHVPAKVRSGYRGGDIPRGVEFGRRRI